MAERCLEIRGLTKDFPGQRVLAGVDLDLHKGEILALAGANGSGKSTLIKILAGFHAPDAGTVTAFGEPTDFGRHDWRERCHFVHQNLGLVETLSATDNLALVNGYRCSRLGRIRWSEQRTAARRAIERFGGSFDLEVPVAALTPAERTIVAIARALDRWDDDEAVLVVDEPTASLHRDEVEKLFRSIRLVAEHGAGVIFVSHRVDEMLELSDRVVVLRDGRLAASVKTSELTHDGLVELIIGHALDAVEEQVVPVADEVVLDVRHLRGERIADVSFVLRRGEILGVTGLLGSGREELTTLLGGAMSRRGGSVQLDGEPLPADSVPAAIRRGLVMVPADRARRGAIMARDLRENVMLPDPAWAYSRGWLSGRREHAEVDRWLHRLQVTPARQELPMALLSGGNQQKVVLAKWLRCAPHVMVLDEPTQGVDVGAKAAIYQMLVDAAREGASIVVCSSEAKDLAAICDRVIVLEGGRVSAELHGAALSEHAITAASIRTTGGITQEGASVVRH
jgi:ribose transport system ATP-binding protein